MAATEPSGNELSRRALLGGALAAGTGMALGARVEGAPDAPIAIPTRPFGKTGRKVTAFGLGCYYVGAATSDKDGIAVVRRALELGCTYFDTAPSYVRGVSERRVGLGLEGRRHDVFLSTKTLERSASGALADVEDSLRRLRTDHVDMVQVHCVRTHEDLKSVLAEDGPLAGLRRARDQGKLRFIGVTGHEDPAVMKAALEAYAWDSVLLPLNPVDLAWKSFLTGTLPTAVAQGIARVGMKVFASGKLVSGLPARPAEKGRPALAARPGLAPEDCLRFAFGLDLSTAIVGCSTPAEVELAARIASEREPLSPERRAALVEQAKALSGTGDRGVEWYKSA